MEGIVIDDRMLSVGTVPNQSVRILDTFAHHPSVTEGQKAASITADPLKPNSDQPISNPPDTMPIAMILEEQEAEAQKAANNDTLAKKSCKKHQHMDRHRSTKMRKATI